MIIFALLLALSGSSSCVKKQPTPILVPQPMVCPAPELEDLQKKPAPVPNAPWQEVRQREARLDYLLDECMDRYQECRDTRRICNEEVEGAKTKAAKKEEEAVE